MQSNVLWTDTMPERDDKPTSVQDVDISPDGVHVIAAVDDRVLMYQASSGELIHSLRGHKGLVTSVSFGYDGTHFASGGVDGGVLWEISGRGVVRYKLQSPIQCVKYNPVSHLILSCADGQLGLCMLHNKQVSKHKVSGKFLSAAWSPDGVMMALGMANGHISVRNRDAEETVRIERISPVAALCFTSSQHGQSNVIVAATWDKVLSVYNTAGEQLIKDRKLSFFPRSVTEVGAKQPILAVLGSDHNIQFFTKAGIKLNSALGQPGWMICAAAVRSKLAVGTERGVLQYMDVRFEPLFALHQERYAYCENLTEIIIANLVTNERVCIKCRDLVRGLAIYNGRLAVQLSGRVHIYQVSNPDDPKDMRYRSKEKLRFDVANSNMLITSRYILFICENVVQAYAEDRRLEREWVFPSKVTANHVVDGPENAEMLLFGLLDGSVHQIFADNSFTMQLVGAPSSKAAVQSMHLSLYRDMLACIYNDTQLVVYSIRTGGVTLFQDSAVTSVCFNSQVNSMLCYTSHDRLLVLPAMGSKAATDFMRQGKSFQPIEQRSRGKVLGFYAAKIMSMNDDHQISWLAVPQDGTLTTYINNEDTVNACTVASLGATPAEWRRLGMAALTLGNIHVAKKAFARIQDSKYLHVVDWLASTSGSVVDSTRVQAELLALQGLFTEAAKTFAREKRIQDAVGIFLDMKKWDDARVFAASASDIDLAQLTIKQAEWYESIGDWKHAALVYSNAKLFRNALQVIADKLGNGWQAAIADIVEAMPQTEVDVLRDCGELLLSSGDDDYSRVVFQKLGDYGQLLNLYVRKNKWQEAVQLVRSRPELDKRQVYTPFGTWLLAQDQFEQALEAYREAGEFKIVTQVLQILTKNAIIEARFKDAAWGYHELAKAMIKLSEGEETTSDEQTMLMEQALAHEHSADLYYAYSHIHAFTTDPFTNLQPEVLFQVSTYVLNNLGQGMSPRGISRANVLYTLVRQAMALNAYKLARIAFDDLQRLQVRQRWTEFIDSYTLVIQSKPMTDDPDLLPVCYRCGHRNPLLNQLANRRDRADACVNCGHPFVRSFINFEILPLVEFVPDATISDDEAVSLIRHSSHDRSSNPLLRGSKGKEQQGSDADLLLLNEPSAITIAGSDAAADENDLFARRVNATLLQQTNPTEYLPVKLDRSTLKSLDRLYVFACKSPRAPFRMLFYRNMLPEVAVALSQPCHRFFHLEDFEFAYLSEGRCPFSRVKDVGDYGPL